MKKVHFNRIIAAIAVIFSISNSNVYSQTCSLGNPVFVEDFGYGTNRLGPSLNLDPNTDVHPDFRPASLYNYVGSGTIGYDQYGLLKNPTYAAPNGGAFWNDSFRDHTADDVGGDLGYMYYCDAKEDLNVFYAQKITGLCPEIEYELSTWFAKTNAPDYFIDPDVKLIVGFSDINDTPIGTIIEADTGPIEGIGLNRWQRHSLVFTVPIGTENIYFMLKNNVSGLEGNDLAIDDIEVRPCGPQIEFTEANQIIEDYICFEDTDNRTINITNTVPQNFVVQWQESFNPGTWDDIAGENNSVLNYTIPDDFKAQYAIRLKFAHNLGNLNNSNCHFFSEEIHFSKNYAYPVDNLTFCDNNSDGDAFNGVIQNINLESQTATILGDQPASNHTISYHLSLSDAITGVGALVSPHENDTNPNSQTIYVRVRNNISGCINTDISFDIIVNSLPNTNPVSNLVLCDDKSDGDNRNGIVQTFDLESQTAAILDGQPASDYLVTYHLSAEDAVSGINPLSSPHSNTLSPNMQTIYVRTTNTITGCFNPYLSFDLIVNPLPFAENAPDLQSCDNFNDGNDTNGIINWDLESQTATILGTQPASDYTVTYHLSILEAELGSNSISSPYTNTFSPYDQTIYVRIENNITQCVNSFTTFDLIVHPVPVVNSPVVLVQCDDDNPTTLGYSPFNLIEANSEISTYATNETFSYFLTQAAAIIGDNTSSDFITNPKTFINRTISSDVVWARVENAFGCFKVSEIQLNVSTTVIPSNFLATFNQCDDFLDTNGLNNTNNNDRDGIATFDFSSVANTLLTFIPPGQNPLPPKYFRNETDALAEENEITDISNYRNIGYPNSQFIYVRVDSNMANDCLALGGHILLNVEPLPIANSVTINRQCDDDNDGLFPFDTSQIESDVLSSQNPADVNVEYFDTLGNSLPSPLPNPFLTVSQVITVRVINNVTSALDGSCYDETNLEFIVDVSPIIANTIPNQVYCDDGTDITLENDGLHSFDTSSFKNTILGTQTDMEVFYDYDENGISITDSKDLPNPLISGNQTINIKVINPLNINCIATTSVNLEVSPIPNFTVESPQIVCTSDPTFTIDLDPIETNANESYYYEWVFEDRTWLSNASILTVSTPGTYSVTLTKTDGTGCAKTRDIIVDGSEKATITQNDVTIVDLSENNSVTINPENLGKGTYEFALKEASSSFINYQSKPVFNNVKSGFYTIYVKNDICGIATLEISVIGHPKHFTPNGDGFNDLWQIKGLNTSFQPNSTIFIFDRYGKLIKQLSPKSIGWDGTFNGNLLPSDDYWFKVSLEDGRQFSGHFALKR